MPIRKRNKDDFMSKEMDERLSEMEASISNVYQQAVEETTARLNSYMQAYEEENRVMRSRLLEGEITEKEYEEWARRNLLRTQQYSTTIDSLTEMLVNADTAAIALVNGELPYVIAESYNFTQFVGHIIADHEVISNVSFEIYNAQSVQAIIRDNPQILPVVDPEIDTEWNRTRLNREITQGIIQGNTIPQLATRLQRVGITDRNSAIRAARTSMTGAENMGRNESHRRITSQGINMVKRWSATYDARTRDTHRLLDDTTANEKGEFGEGILDKLGEPLMEYPGDPKGAAAEIYNCRCRLNVVPPNYSREANAQAYERWMQENYPADYRALNESNYFDRLHKTDEWTSEAQRRVDRRIEKLRENNASKGYADANDLERAIMADGGSLTDPRLLAYSNTLEEESKYNASLKNNLEQAIQENGYTEGIRNAIEAEERDAQNYLDNLPELKTPEQIATAEAMQERLRILSALKPSEDNIVASISNQNVEIPEGARRALDAFERRNQNKSKEYSMVVDADGNIIGEAGGRARSTALSQSQNIASEGNYHIHNHPIENIIYSDQDIVNYEKYGVRGGIVITRDGTEYQLINSNPISRYDELERLRREVLYGDMTEEEYSRRYRELMPFSSSVTGAFNTIETEWREERRATLDRIYAELPLPSDRNERIAVMDERERRYNAWVESVGNDNDRKIRWLEENASRYGFTFIRRRIS